MPVSSAQLKSYNRTVSSLRELEGDEVRLDSGTPMVPGAHKSRSIVNNQNEDEWATSTKVSILSESSCFLGMS